MPSSLSRHAALLPLLPEDKLGEVQQIEQVRRGLSGAGVYAVTTSRGGYILRVQGNRIEPSFFEQHLRILRRAADALVAPAIAHVDEAARAVVSARVVGVELSAALADADAAKRGLVVRSVIGRLRALHALDATDVVERDPVTYARRVWEAARERPGFPSWTGEPDAVLAPSADALATDPRRVVSHYDVNPRNVLWDGTQTWLIDWDAAGLGHPYYDLAALATGLRLDEEVAFNVVAAHDGSPLDERSRATFRAIRPLVPLLWGFTMLGLVDDLRAWPAATPADAQTLSQCYDGFRSGELDLQTPRGCAVFGLALISEGLRQLR